jgi:hypothetical protein
MVQVDVFWTYALGATSAVAASRQLRQAHRRGGTAWNNTVLTKTLLFLSILFVPSGVCLLWAFPSWETMHVGDRHLPAWLVTAFAATNVTQGVLGFWVAYQLIVRRRSFLAFLQIFLGYFLMCFILVHGWDGTGYQRFFSPTREAFLDWQPATIGVWCRSDVAFTLAGFAIVLLPVLLRMYAGWLAEGYALAESNPAAARAARAPLVRWLLTMVLVGGLGAAVLASVLVHTMGWLLGGALFAVVAYALGVHRCGLLRYYHDRLALEDHAPHVSAEPIRVGSIVASRPR